MSKARRAPPPPGRGAAIARQMGLLVELSPEGTAGDTAGDDAAELEAELLALVGAPAAPGDKPAAKAALPMEAIERMAALCLRDEEDEDDEELGDDADLMAELQEVLGDGDGAAPAPPSEVPPEPLGAEPVLLERADMYRAAMGNARQSGDAPRLRRLERGLKTLENMLVSVRKGKPINEEEIPPPVALGKGGTPPQPPAVPTPQSLPVVAPDPPAEVTPDPPAEVTPDPPSPRPQPGEVLLRERQREYKVAALDAKRCGDLETATRYYRVAKGLEPALEAAAQGGPVEPHDLPPPPGADPPRVPKEPPPEPQPASPATEAPGAPRTTLEALEQRMERYRAAAAQAKGKGDERKARMHERIVKQYEAAIRAHKAGRAVDFSELPVPPGFEPLAGAEAPGGGQSLAAVLEVAAKLVNQDGASEEDEDPPRGPPQQPPPRAAPQQPPPRAPPAGAPNASTGNKPAPKNNTKAQQQLAFLALRKRQLTKAALRAKQSNDLEGAKGLLRRAKALEPLLEAARGGLPVDISKVPEAPVDAEEFVLVARGGPRVPPEAAARYLELGKLIRQQHEMCVSCSRQFAQLGNIAETTKFEALAQECRQHMELLKQAHARGSAPPRHRYEQRTFSIIKVFPELSSSDLVLAIVKGINLPAPTGVAPNDLDAFVRFEFPFPNAEEAQKDKTNVIKNTDSPEFQEHFKLSINRGHRGLRRVLQNKGIKFEVLHKGGLFKPDRVLGSAQLKLEALETTCQVREILELLDGRRRTGGRLEVTVTIREPLGAPQLESRTERWLVIVPSAVTPVPVPKGKPAVVAPRDGSNRAAPTLPSLNLLAFDREKLERKMLQHTRARRPVPPELREQHQELVRRSQNLRGRLQSGDPPFQREYRLQLERHLHLCTEAARRLGTEGNRDAAKEALYKRNLVESELQKLRP
ncbi:coiled-coil and C2 domain-containing protein 1A isoform X2 [Patagioenas fasciata]|uniref:coiled-coil and C2 domain-containing protein 1A isoform X2 n=1 Tax=Patagioenas fasciata TaxID=372321 RepID=UPI003A99FF07